MSAEPSDVAALGSSVLLLALGVWLLFVAGAGIVLRSDVAARLGTSGDVVATSGAVVALVGLAVLFWAYRLGSSASTKNTMPRDDLR